MAKKKRGGKKGHRRPFKIKGELRVFLRARGRKEAIAKLRKVVEDYIADKLETFEMAAPKMAEKLVDSAVGGSTAKFWSKDAKRDRVYGTFRWTNKKGGKYRPGVPIEVDEKAFTVDRAKKGKRARYRDARGRFIKRPGSKRRRRA